MNRIYQNVGNDDAFQEHRNTLDTEEKYIFLLFFTLGYITSLSEKEIQSFPPRMQQILFTCILIGTVSPIPGGTLALTLPLSAITWKYRDKIWELVNMKIAQWYN